MGVNGCVALWTPSPTCCLEHALMVSLKLTGAAEIAWATRYAKPPEEWRKISREVEEGASEPDDPFELVGHRFPIDRVPSLFGAGTTLSIHFGQTPLGTDILQDVERSVPLDIRGKFSPADPIITVGGHDLWGDSSENKDGVEFHGRAEFSFKVFGYGVPDSMTRYREVVFDTPRIKRLKEDLERDTGPLKQSAYWSW